MANRGKSEHTLSLRTNTDRSEQTLSLKANRGRSETHIKSEGKQR